MGSMATALSSEDVLVLILSRVTDPLDLLCCAATCPRWFRVIVAPPFSLWPDSKASTFLLGIFSQKRSRVPVPVANDEEYFPPHFSRLATGGGTTSFSFFPDDDDDRRRPFNYAMPLASRRGLLLLRIDDDTGTNELRLAVCYPLIGCKRTTHLVPPPPFRPDPDLDELTGYALLTSRDLRQHQQQPAFQVLLITAVVVDDSLLLYAYSYSSWTGAWSRSEPIQVAASVTMSGDRAGIVVSAGGGGGTTIHWLYRDGTNFYTLDLTASHMGMARACLTRIPAGVILLNPTMTWGRPLLCVAPGEEGPGRLSLLTIFSSFEKIELWSCKHGEWVWIKALCRRNQTQLVMFAESRGAMLVEQGNQLLALDLKTMHMETVMTSSSHRRPWRFNASVLYEMDWPSYIAHVSAGFLSASR